jgi:hypothetical protein
MRGKKCWFDEEAMREESNNLFILDVRYFDRNGFIK